MKSTANKTRPKVMNAGMDWPHWMAITMSQAVVKRLWAFRLRFSNEQIETSRVSTPSANPTGMATSNVIPTMFLFEHDLFGKPVPTFPDHALTEQGRLLTDRVLLGFECRNRRHVENDARGNRRGEDMRRPRRSDQDRPDRKRVRKHLDHLI